MLFFVDGLWSAVSAPSGASASSSSEERASLPKRVSERRGRQEESPKGIIRVLQHAAPPACRPGRGTGPAAASRRARAAAPLPAPAGQGTLRAPRFTCLDGGGQRRLGQRASPQQPRVALLLRLGGHRLRGRELQEGVPLLGSLGHAPQRRRLCPGAARAAPMGGGRGRGGRGGGGGGGGPEGAGGAG